jgi:lipopolysaccharide transport system permease protein
MSRAAESSSVAGPPEGGFTKVIQPTRGWRPINWREILAYKDLLFFLVRRDVKARHAQTIIGFGWAIIRPFFTMVVFTIVFGELASVPSDGVPYPLFSFTALVPWTYFSTAITQTTGSLVWNASLLTKVYFPRLIIPLTPVLAGLVDFFIALGVLGGMMVLYGIVPDERILIVPLLVLLMILCSIGIGTWLSALSIQYRDIQLSIPFMGQLLMYAAPVVWPVSLITERFPDSAATIRLLYGLYPMAGVIEGFRSALLGTVPMAWDLIAAGFVSSVVLAVSGSLYFRRMERVFADVA